MKKILFSFKFAVSGIYHALVNEVNFRIQIVIALYVLYFMHYSSLDKLHTAVIYLCFVLVFSAELFNTAIERVVDYFCLEKREEARIIKDVSAGAVLISSLGAVCIGLTLLWEKSQVLGFLSMLMGSGKNIAITTGAVIVSILFVFKFGKVRK